MSLRKFGPNDILLNTLRTYPEVEYLIYDGNVFYNQSPNQSGTVSDNLLSVTGGALSLYEYNIDRKTAVNPYIYPYITKDSARSSFKTAGGTSYYNEFVYGDVITGSYPLAGRIDREYMAHPGARVTGSDIYSGAEFAAAAVYPHFYALKNRLNYYGYLSEHYKVSSSLGDGWNKNNQAISLISIPAIMFGSQIKEGSLSLKWYVSGTLKGELQDSRQNGELVEVFRTGSNTGEVAGVVLYNEGFIVLTGSWAICNASMQLEAGGAMENPKWINFGAGAYDGVTQATAGATFVSAAFGINFKAQSETQTYTLFANARRGEVNYSNNPTYLRYGQTKIALTSSTIYEENSSLKIKNFVSSSLLDYSAPFKRQTIISRIGIYDKNKNLLGIATLANPLLKNEDQDYTFKIKLDI
tara:strand:- start:1650 stop:2885 length:1236 start_codon:yes stop_codon:yes gene_type:complete